MLYGWMKNLIVYLIFAGAIINLSPSGSYKKHIRLVTGLVAIIIIIKPMSFIFSYDEKELYGLINRVYSESQINFDEYSLGEPCTAETCDYLQLGISEGIKQELNDRGLEVVQVSVVTDDDNNLLNCRVYVGETNTMEGSFQEENIKKYISEVYNLELDNIYVVRR
ncbi:MAG: stage III sporulation protein AF [Lachnospiraceae bacterium]|nr:stage III sporulation protein AF [Lachnospiraceae bacterium]